MAVFRRWTWRGFVEVISISHSAAPVPPPPRPCLDFAKLSQLCASASPIEVTLTFLYLCMPCCSHPCLVLVRPSSVGFAPYKAGEVAMTMWGSANLGGIPASQSLHPSAAQR